MRQTREVLVFFPYMSETGLHPWIKNELQVFDKLGYKNVIISLPSKVDFSTSTFRFILQLLLLPIHLFRCSVILIPTSYLMLLPILIAKALGKKIFISHLSTMGDPSEKINTPSYIKYFMRLSDKASFHSADYVLTFSVTIAKEICKKQKLVFDANKFYCSEVIDTKLFKPEPKIDANLRNLMGLESNYVLFYHGKFHPFHGMEYFFKAFKKLYKANKNVRLIVLSFPNGMERNVLDKDIINHPGIIFLPPVQYEKLVDLLQVADLWVGRFKYDKEGDTAFSTCGVEAMACGKPIITYNNIENSRVIKDGVNGLLVPGENVDAIVNKIKPYLNQSGMKTLKTMGELARKTAIKEFDNRKLLSWILKTTQ